MDNGVALITGGASGIGFAVAAQLGRAGYTGVVLGRNTESGRQAATALCASGIDAVGDGADFSNHAEVASLRERLGPLAEPEILVCSAGVMSEKMSKTLRTAPDEWDRVLGVNLLGVVNALSHFAPPMVAARSGRVIALSACLGRFSGPGTSGGLAPYRVSKAAVNALIRNFAAETGWGARGVLVDAVCPNHCRTPMGGPDAPRSADEGAETVAWLAQTDLENRQNFVGNVDFPLTGLLWEDQEIISW
ncbi:MAG: SDR family NAD(P)-dependent oxidoreductase [Actinomycetales bacterium]|nr:SDR family NAD(P)-dependent oxidoreductase [Actinomycetales bacterium]